MTVEEFQKKFGIIGKSKEIRDICSIAMQVAKSDISVLLYGESGVGKEIFASAIHNYSPRADKQLVSVNCGAIPEGILESELFGHKRGSFTGAVESRKGYFEIADNGTLFLDEIGEMPLTTQVKLLRVLETQEFMRIGGETVTKVDVRIIAATNKDLQVEVDSKRFREDLYFRLKAVTLHIPPLRRRKGDIEELVNFFLVRVAAQNKIPLPRITPEAMNYLVNYSWPGNIRELRNTIESAVTLNITGTLDESLFIQLLKRELPPHEETRNLPISLHKSGADFEREMIYRALIEIKKDLVELKQAFFEKPQTNGSINGYDVEEISPLYEVEKNSIIKALNYSKGNKRLAAKALKISERTLYRKIKEYDIEV